MSEVLESFLEHINGITSELLREAEKCVLELPPKRDAIIAAWLWEVRFVFGRAKAEPRLIWEGILARFVHRWKLRQPLEFSIVPPVTHAEAYRRMY
jgi:hypothetical protein